ncbi:MAG: helix-turn-helix domain-containing protein [Phycisphaerales bacterium]|nr:helix-turn-helix domain-containing protein [Phycisphaerales bacterium]
MARPTKPLNLTASERESSSAMGRRPKSAQRLAQRARIALLCGEGRSGTAVAARLGLTVQTVGKWRKRFRLRRLEREIKTYLDQQSRPETLPLDRQRRPDPAEDRRTL